MRHLYHQRDYRSPKNILCRTKREVRPYYSVYNYINNAWAHKEGEDHWCPECVDKVPLYELAATEL